MIHAMTNNFEFGGPALTMSVEYFKNLRGDSNSLVNESIIG